jgi:putative FmdB family regulatory protein
MPIYEYECEHCGVRFEKLQRMTEPSLTDCPECGGHIHRVMQPVGVIFKGSGFYVTDHKGRSSTQIPGNKKEEDGKPAAAPSSAGSEAAPAPAPAPAPASSAKTDSSGSEK